MPSLDFEVFLLALGKSGLIAWLARFQLGDAVPDAIHRELTELVRKYFVVGGMPATVSTYVQGGARETEREQQMILSTYHDDFPKYSSRIRADLLQKVFVSVPSMLGRKLIYTHLVEGENQGIYLLHMTFCDWPGWWRRFGMCAQMASQLGMVQMIEALNRCS